MHNPLQWYDYLRFLTIGVSVGCMYVLVARRVRVGHTYTPRIGDLWWVLIGYLFLSVEGTLEQIIINAPWGPRVFFSFGMALFCALILYKHRRKVSPDEESFGT